MLGGLQAAGWEPNHLRKKLRSTCRGLSRGNPNRGQFQRDCVQPRVSQPWGSPPPLDFIPAGDAYREIREIVLLSDSLLGTGPHIANESRRSRHCIALLPTDHYLTAYYSSFSLVLPQRCCPIRERNFGSGVAVASRPPSETKAQKNKTSAWRPKLLLQMKFQVSRQSSSYRGSAGTQTRSSSRGASGILRS